MSKGIPASSLGSTSASLLERIKIDDPSAWERLVELYGPVVYRWARASGLQADDAADVVQEVFCAINKSIGRFRRERFRGWLWTITRNEVRDHFRRLARRADARGGTTANLQFHQLPDLPDERAATDRGELFAQDELPRRALELVRSEFQPKTWQAFYRVTVEGDRPGDVAEDLGMNVSAVYMAKSRVFRRVRDELRGLYD
jgi:RNA polymerase sigma-70 factor (ECF subfamily)